MKQMKLHAEFHVDLPTVEVAINNEEKDFSEMTKEEKYSVIYVLSTILGKIESQIKDDGDNGEEE